MRRLALGIVMLLACAGPASAPSRVVLTPQHGSSQPTPVHVRSLAWTARDLPRPFTLIAAGGHGVVYLAGRGVLQRSSDAGRTFVDATLPRPSSPHDDGLPRSMWARDDRVVVSTMYEVWASRDGGGTWSLLAEPKIRGTVAVPSPITAVWGSGSELYFATHIGEVHHSSDDGRTWQSWDSQTGGAFLALGGSREGIVAVVGCFGDFFRSSDRGATWVGGHSLHDSLCWTSVTARDARHFVAVARDHSLARSDDGGAHWQDAKAGVAARAVAVGARGDWTVVGDAVARSFDDGRTWQREPFALGAPPPFVEEPFRSGSVALDAVARDDDAAWALGRRAGADGETYDDDHSVFAVVTAR